jgi:hypothetical protein
MGGGMGIMPPVAAPMMTMVAAPMMMAGGASPMPTTAALGSMPSLPGMLPGMSPMTMPVQPVAMTAQAAPAAAAAAPAAPTPASAPAGPNNAELITMLAGEVRHASMCLLAVLYPPEHHLYVPTAPPGGVLLSSEVRDPPCRSEEAATGRLHRRKKSPSGAQLTPRMASSPPSLLPSLPPFLHALHRFSGCAPLSRRNAAASRWSWCPTASQLRLRH